MGGFLEANDFVGNPFARLALDRQVAYVRENGAAIAEIVDMMIDAYGDPDPLPEGVTQEQADQLHKGMLLHLFETPEGRGKAAVVAMELLWRATQERAAQRASAGQTETSGG